MTFKKQLIEAYKAGIKKALSLVNEELYGYSPIFPGVHFQTSQLTDCHQIDHFKDVSNWDDLADKAFKWAGLDHWWKNSDLTDEALGKDDYKLWSPFLSLKKSYNYFLERGGMEKNSPNDHSFSDLCSDLAQCFAGLNWATPRIEHSNLPREKKEQLSKVLLAIKRAYKHIGYEVRCAGRRANSKWDS